MGRHAYTPTEADRNTVRIMAAIGIKQDRICACVGTDGIDEKTLRKYFRREIDVAKDQMDALAGQGLARGLQNGESWAVCFYLKTRMGWRETNRTELTGADGGPMQVETSAKDLLAARISGIAARTGTQSDPR
jgi:hypothetical protein